MCIIVGKATFSHSGAEQSVSVKKIDVLPGGADTFSEQVGGMTLILQV